MKPTQLPLVALAIGVALVQTSFVSAQSLNDGLVAYYPFNGNVDDASGNGHDGAATAVLPAADRFGRPGKALLFDGLSSSVEVASLADLPYSPATYSLWIRILALPEFPPGTGHGDGVRLMTLLGREASTFTHSGSVALGSDIRTVMPEPYTNQFCYNFGGGAMRSNYSPPTDEWLQLAVTVEAPTPTQRTITWFINGEQQYAGTWDNSEQTDVLPFTIGSSFGQPSPFFYFNGMLDDVRIYSRVLTPQQVEELYNLESRLSLTDGLAAHYQFNGNANDASGNQNNGTLIGAQPAADRFGRADRAYAFNGESDYVETPSSASLEFGDQITVAAWIYPDVILPSQAQGGRTTPLVVKGVDVEGPVDWMFVVNGEQERPGLFVNGSWVYWDSSAGIQAQRWQHVVFTYDGNAMTTYLDAVQTGQQAASGTFRISDGSLRIGAYAPINATASDIYFPGRIDDVRIYDRALTGEEVTALYELETSPGIDISRAVKLVQYGLVVGNEYQLQQSTNLTDWVDVGNPFTATENLVTSYVDVADYHVFYRLVEVTP